MGKLKKYGSGAHKRKERVNKENNEFTFDFRLAKYTHKANQDPATIIKNASS